LSRYNITQFYTDFYQVIIENNIFNTPVYKYKTVEVVYTESNLELKFYTVHKYYISYLLVPIK
jgi:hypothetical protein